jgi:hypothetical protein
MKKNLKAMYFYAYWDNNFDLKDDFIDFCKDNDITYEVLDCETEFGVKLSCKYDVKLCPTILLFKNNKEVYRSHSKNCIEEMCKLI